MNAKKVNAAHDKNDQSIHNFEKFSMDDFGADLQYKQVAKDPTLPKNISGRRMHCLDVMHQESPFVSPHHSDDEGGAQQMDEERTVAKVLMGMGQGLANSNYFFNKEDGMVEEVEDKDEVEIGSYGRWQCE